MPLFTVYLTTHSYERWDNVEGTSQEELEQRLGEEDYEEVLGSSDKEDCTLSEWDIYPEANVPLEERIRFIMNGEQDEPTT